MPRTRAKKPRPCGRAKILSSADTFDADYLEKNQAGGNRPADSALESKPGNRGAVLLSAAVLLALALAALA